MVRTIGDAIDIYRTAAQANGLSPRTIEWVVTVARYFAAFVGAKTPLEELGLHDMRRFIAALQTKERFTGHPFNRSQGRLSPFTVRNYVGAVKLLIGTLIKEESIEAHPLASLRLPKVPLKLVEPLKEGQIRLLFQTLASTNFPLRNCAIAAMMLDTGARVSKVAGIRLGDLDLEARTVKVLGKGARERVLPLGAWATKQILLYLHKERPADTPELALFIDATGKPMAARAIQLVFKRGAEAWHKGQPAQVQAHVCAGSPCRRPPGPTR